MKFFIDTANLSEIKEAHAMGVLDGVTTNPSLCAKEGISDFEGFIAEICKIVEGDVSAEVVATDYEGILAEGHKLAKIADNVVVKVPLIKEGIKAIKTFSEEGIKTNCTLCFSPTQALVAAKAGATYISPFVGRLDDISTNGMQLIAEIVQIYQNYGYETEVLVASIRHPLHVVEAGQIGADVATMPFAVIERLIKHPLTDIGLKNFLADWDKLQESLKK
ncbi:MAG: fructose-6-phosphate aldolase [Balneolaceae bacterium]|nr:MAG: fructose-6-phosphate aldolase [Balneolaceae bacterium]